MDYFPKFGKRHNWGGLSTLVNAPIIFTFNMYNLFLMVLYANEEEDLFIHINA